MKSLSKRFKERKRYVATSTKQFREGIFTFAEIGQKSWTILFFKIHLFSNFVQVDAYTSGYKFSTPPTYVAFHQHVLVITCSHQQHNSIVCNYKHMYSINTYWYHWLWSCIFSANNKHAVQWLASITVAFTVHRHVQTRRLCPLCHLVVKYPVWGMQILCRWTRHQYIWRITQHSLYTLH